VWQEDKGFPKPVLLIRDVFPDPGSNFFLSLIQVPRSEFFPSRIRIPDRIKELKYFNPKKWFLSSRKYDPGCSFQIPDRDPDLSIPDPGSRGQKAPDPGSRIRNTMQNQSTNSMELMPGVLKSLKIRAQAFSPFTQTYVLWRTLVAKAEMYWGKDRAA
jgi:hypothetical protein